MKCADTRLWIVLALIIGTVFGIGADGNQLADYSVSCNNARSMRTNSAEFCWMVSWVSATLYNRTNFNVYTTDAPITMIEQDLVAQAFATELVDMSSDRASKECKNAVRRFACVSVFPYCLKVGRSFSSSSYLPPCKMQCQHVNQACSTSLYAQVSDPVSIDCGAYKLDHNCLLNVPADRFLLSPQQGPYEGIAAVYVAMLIVWALVGALWTYRLFGGVHADTALPASKALCVVPMLRVFAAVFSVVFWLDCVENSGLCHNIRATTLLMFLPFVEAVQMFLFLALAKGWGTTRASLSPNTWRCNAGLSFGFYVGLTVFSRTLSPASVNWIIYSVALYGTMFIVILRAATREMACLQGQVRCLTAHMAVDAVQSLRDKHSMFLCFLVLAFCELLLEGSCRYMLAAKHVPFLALLLVYELVSTGILLGVGWSFRPRQYSPFHFMVPTSLEYAPVPPVPTMLGGDEGEGEGERVQGGWLGGVWASRDERDIGLRSTRNNEQTPSPFVEIFVSHQEFADLPSKSVCATAIEDRNTAVRTMSMSTIPAATTSVASRSPQHGQRQQHQRGVEMEMVRRASGPNTRTATTGLGIVASATAAPAPASSLEAPPFPASLGAPIAESLDLARLLASVGSSLLPGEALSAASAPALGASAQAPVGRGVVEVAGAAVEGGTGSAGQLRLRDLGLGGDGDVDIMNTNPQNRQSMQMQSDIHTAGTAADIITATAPPPSLYSQWASRGRGGGGRSTEARRAGPRTPHMIAVTAPHCEEEVILAISNIH